MPGIINSNETIDFINALGTEDRGDAMPETAKALVELAGFLIDTATDNLQRKGNVATGDTASSMKAVNLDLTGTKTSIEVQILSTYKFLDQGVKGTKGGTGKYQFKNNFVGKKMHSAIKKWIKKRGLGGKIKYKAVSTAEQKNKNLNKLGSADSIAYAVATNIKKKGIKPTKFFTNAVKATEKESRKRFAAALKIDIINSINGN